MLLVKPSLPGSSGNAVCFTYNKMHKVTCRVNQCKKWWLPLQLHLQCGASVRMIFNAPNRKQAEAYLVEIVKKYEKIAPRLADWVEVNLPQGFSFYEFPREHWRRIRTSNCLERVSQEIKHRTRVVRVFLNEASCLRLVSAILMEIGEDWEFGRVYLQMYPELLVENIEMICGQFKEKVLHNPRN